MHQPFAISKGGCIRSYQSTRRTVNLPPAAWPIGSQSLDHEGGMGWLGSTRSNRTLNPTNVLEFRYSGVEYRFRSLEVASNRACKIVTTGQF